MQHQRGPNRGRLFSDNQMDGGHHPERRATAPVGMTVGNRRHERMRHACASPVREDQADNWFAWHQQQAEHRSACV